MMDIEDQPHSAAAYQHLLLDDDTRPTAVQPGPLSPEQQNRGEHLVMVHNMFRQQMQAVMDVRDRLKAGRANPGELRAQIAELSFRQDYERLGAFCTQYCQLLSMHHAIEDQHMFPGLRGADPALGQVIDRLSEEHVSIHEILVRLDAAAVELTRDPESFAVLDTLIDLLGRVLLSHLSYEESQLVAPLGFYDLVV